MNDCKFPQAVILDCNAGAFAGNYFAGQMWKICKARRAPGQVFAAVDCLIPFQRNDSLGALVGEWEMHRVMGLKGQPSSKQWSQKRIDLLAESIYEGLLRDEFYRLRYIVACQKLNYMQAVAYAFRKADLFNRATFIVSPPAIKIVLGQIDSILKAPHKQSIRLDFDPTSFHNNPWARYTLRRCLERLVRVQDHCRWWDATTTPQIWDHSNGTYLD